MRGQILGVDRNSGDAHVTGEDGRRYAFRREDWADSVGPAVGAMVVCDWSSDVCSSDLVLVDHVAARDVHQPRSVAHRGELVRTDQIGRASCRERV